MKTIVMYVVIALFAALGVIVPGLGAILGGTADTLTVVCTAGALVTFGVFIGLHIPDRY